MSARFHNQVLFEGEGFDLAIFQNPDLSPMGGGDIANPLGKGHWAFRVSPETFAEARARFAEAQVPTHDPIDWGDHDCLYFLDPDGNLLELVAYR